MRGAPAHDYGVHTIPGPKLRAVLFSLGAILVMGVGASFIVSRVIALPAQVILDIIRAFTGAWSAAWQRATDTSEPPAASEKD